MIEKIALSVPGGFDLDPVAGMPEGGNPAVVKFIESGISYLLLAATFLALVFLIYGGIQWITSQGDKAKVEGARNKIMYAIIGLIVAFGAFFIINIIGNFFKVDLLKIPRCNPGTHYACAAGTCKCIPN